MQNVETYIKKLKSSIIGAPRNPLDINIFHKLSLISLFAWVGLGSDAMSSSSYGPQEAYLALGGHTYLALFVALGIVLTFFVIIVLILLNLRGIKESVLFLVPIFALFAITHVILITYAFSTHLTSIPAVMNGTVTDAHSVTSEVGFAGLLFIILHSYSMGAGTYTGLEAVSNAVPVLREPRVHTAKRTMHLMAISLAFMAAGLLFVYILYNVVHEPGKTLNATLFENVTKSWGALGTYFVIATLMSEAGLLFVAAQTGFIDGPRVLANMALDRWVPTKFATLSDRLVTQNGILIMGISALIMVFLTKGSVERLVVLYSIAVFITFFLSQAGMVRHWWKSKTKVKNWKKKFIINGVGLVMTVLILISVILVKFNEGGWVTLLIIAAFAGVVFIIRRHYDSVSVLIKELNAEIINSPESTHIIKNDTPDINMQDKTAVLLVNGFNGLGILALSSIFKLFGGTFKNFVFVQIGVIDAGVFKGVEEINGLQAEINKDIGKYVELISSYGYHAESITSIGTDVVAEVTKLAPDILKKFPNAVFFGG